MIYTEYKSKYEIRRDKLRDLYGMEKATHEEVLLEAIKRAEEYNLMMKEKMHRSNKAQILDAYTN